MKKREQYYKLLSKTGVNKVIYSLLSKMVSEESKNFTDLDISDLYPDIKSTCIIERDESWKNYEYDLDVIIPVYNTGELLNECLRSLTGQRSKYNFRVIVVDDGSTDKRTLEILEENESGNENLKVIHKKNEGISKARNDALEASKGQFIMFVDSDDVLFDGAIDALMDAAKKNEADIVDASYKNIDADGKVLKDYPHKVGEIQSYNDYFGYIWAKVYNRKIFSEVQFPLYFFEDSINKTVLYEKAEKIIGISDFVYGYRRNRRSISFSVQGQMKSLDSFWITKQITEDRHKLDISDDNDYYEYLLKLIKLTYRRNIHLNQEYQVNLFYRWCDLMKDYSDYKSANNSYKDLEKAIRIRNFALYRLWCEMNMF